jgi:hypothetical protein
VTRRGHVSVDGREPQAERVLEGHVPPQHLANRGAIEPRFAERADEIEADYLLFVVEAVVRA